MKTGTPPRSPLDQLADYRGPAGSFDEFRTADGLIRPGWTRFLDALEQTREHDLRDNAQLASRLLRENGTNITGSEQEDGDYRPWELDLLPVLFEADEWGVVQTGVEQRARLVEALTRDLYGSQKLLKNGIIPPDVVFRSPHFERAFATVPEKFAPLMLYGCELARDSNGTWQVLADRASSPGGLAYAVQNRVVISNALSRVLHRCRIKRLAPFSVQLQEALKQAVGRRKNGPSIVILSEGPSNQFYFEDIFLARYLGYPLIEAGDLTVRRNRLCLKTLEGLIKVDLVLRRTADARLDPLEVSSTNQQGIAGLLQVIRNCRTVLANGPAFGLADTPVFMPFLPAACQYLLGEELQLHSIDSWWCGEEAQRKFVCSHLDELVVKPAFVHSGGEEIYPAQMSSAEKESLLARIEADPAAFVAQRHVTRSTSPCWVNNQVRPGHIALRSFCVRNEQGFHAMDGGLVRVQTADGPMQLSVDAGEFSKDVWVCSDTPVEPVSLLPKMQQTPSLRRTNLELLSRSADNLFWLGRYLERQEAISRQIRKVTERLLYESADQPVPDVQPLLMSLADQEVFDKELLGVEGEFSRGDIEKTWPECIFDSQGVDSYRGLHQKIYELAWQVRDRMSADFWRAINIEHHRELFVGATSERGLGELLDDVNQRIGTCCSLTGQVMDGLVHGPARLFLLIGRYLERARQLGFLLKHYLAHDNEAEVLSLVTLLESCNSLMTYRSRYRGNFAPLPVFDLLVTDAANPRALVFQFVQLEELFQQLPQPPRRAQTAPYMHIIRQLRHRTESILPRADHAVAWPSYRGRTAKVLAELEPAVKETTDLLTKIFFAHVGVTRPIDSSLRGRSL